MVCEVFCVALQVNFLSSLLRVEDSDVANLVADDLSGLLLTSTLATYGHHCNFWKKKISQIPPHDTSEDQKQKDDF